MVMSAPHANTRAAASGSAKMLNSATAVALPTPALPPMREMPAMRRGHCGSRSMASAKLVSGPTAMIHTSGAAASSRNPTASSLAGVRSCGVRSTPAKPSSPCTPVACTGLATSGFAAPT